MKYPALKSPVIKAASSRAQVEVEHGVKLPCTRVPQWLHEPPSMPVAVRTRLYNEWHTGSGPACLPALACPYRSRGAPAARTPPNPKTLRHARGLEARAEQHMAALHALLAGRISGGCKRGAGRLHRGPGKDVSPHKCAALGQSSSHSEQGLELHG